MPKPLSKPRFTRVENKRWEGGGKFTPQRKFCAFCADKTKNVDYKDAAKLRRYISDRGRIEPRRRTGTCAEHQRALSLAIKRARQLALLPYVAEHIRRMGWVPMQMAPEPPVARGGGELPAAKSVAEPPVARTSAEPQPVESPKQA